MHFGEYELSPSLIGLSLLPSPHPEAFQRLSVRSSIPCYRDFNLDKGRSLGFASATADYAPYSDSLSLRLRASLRLTLPTTATRRFIMQKARRHIIKMLRPLVGVRWMPRLLQAMKDVISCDKLWEGANDRRSADFRMGQPGRLKTCHPAKQEANEGN